MISGTVFPDRQARLTVELLSADGQFQPFQFILDTGFTGDLSLLLKADQLLTKPIPHSIINPQNPAGKGGHYA